MAQTDTAYQVLARKYRPQDFSALIGQEAMVRVLRNAFEANRIHHAYVLTGVRGVGKTTTARIIAKGLNCIGVDRPTVEPCGECENCVSIMEGRHVDVIELDAASHTGIDDVREIIEGAKYRPAMARYKVYIIDETHMLSKNAFNGLLKTLEEPPAHVKFLFATTEIRKMPITVLSRCQRFDLRRIEPEQLIANLEMITEKEGAEIDRDALALIARAAEGSVRDAQSLLDQAIADGGKDAEAIRRMLGLADRTRVLELFRLIMKGEAAAAIAELRDQYKNGADAEVTLSELAETAHWLSTLKISPDLANDPAQGAEAREIAGTLAAEVPMRVLARAWQMLLKALEEVARAPSPLMAAEMAVIRLCAVSDLPSPEDLVKKLTESGDMPSAPRGPAPSGGGGGAGGATAIAAVAAHAIAAPEVPRSPVALAVSTPDPQPSTAAQTRTAESAETADLPQDFEAMVALIREKRDGELLYDVETGVKLVIYQPGRLEFELAPGAREDLAGRLTQRLGAWTGTRWGVSVVTEPGLPTLAETRSADLQTLEQRVKKHPMIAAAFKAFPEAEMRVIPRERAANEAEPPPPIESDDDEDLLGED